MKKIVWLIIIFLFFAIFSSLYYASHRQPENAMELASKVSRKLSEIDSYEYSMSTELSSVLNEDKANLMTGTGRIDYKNRKSHNIINFQNNTAETILIDDLLYARENNGVWMMQETNQAWKMGEDQLLSQKIALRNSSIMHMERTENGWKLMLDPGKEAVLADLYKKSIETIKPEELNTFTVSYEIDEEYFIKRIETKIQVEMNIQGLVRPMNILTVVDLYNYNKDFEIEVPV